MTTKKIIFSFLNLLLFLAVFLGIYYWIWSSAAGKAKLKIETSLSKAEYSSVKISGFPIQKKITINDLSLYIQRDYISDKKVIFKKVVISSLMFSNKAKVDLGKTILYKSYKDKEIGKLEYNSPPEISFSLNKDKSFKSFNYSDIGYKVLNETNTTISSAGASEFKINATKSERQTDYEITSSMIDIQNVSILDKEGLVQSQNKTPRKNSIIADILFSKAHETNPEFRNLLQINTFSVENEEYKVFIDGSIEREKKGILPYGKITIRIQNFDNFIKPVTEAMLVSINKKYRDKTFLQNLSRAERETAKRTERERIKKIPNKLTILANQNEDSSNNIKVFVITRNRDGGAFYVNNKTVAQLIKKFKETSE